ncbi:MAG: indolepyruvate oxidoreductase subunit beta [Thermoplasmata archaeon]|nr:indolepyruvate oxidoreductase subunit beta [Thermoplasmata archaeon]
MNGEFSAIVCGVGGQGIVLLSNIIGDACANSGLRAITGEQHGLSQRSGSVSIHVRIGARVRSPLIPVGMADAIISLEALETLRYLEYLKEGGIALMNSRIMHPISDTGRLVKNKAGEYFDFKEIESRLSQITKNILSLDALELANKAGNPLTENVVLLGAISVLEAFPIQLDALRQSISKVVPAKAIEANLRAFEYGAEVFHDRFCKEMRCKSL